MVYKVRAYTEATIEAETEQEATLAMSVITCDIRADEMEYEAITLEYETEADYNAREII